MPLPIGAAHYQSFSKILSSIRVRANGSVWGSGDYRLDYDHLAQNQSNDGEGPAARRPFTVYHFGKLRLVYVTYRLTDSGAGNEAEPFNDKLGKQPGLRPDASGTAVPQAARSTTEGVRT